MRKTKSELLQLVALYICSFNVCRKQHLYGMIGISGFSRETKLVSPCWHKRHLVLC